MFRWVPVLLAMAACHHDTTTKTTPVSPPTTAAPAPGQPAPPAQHDEAALPVSQHVQASPDVVRECKLRASTEQEAAPKFGFDQAELTADDRTVLQQIAECVTHGPLRGKNLQLVGRADPRGTDEYNMGLGDRRAHSVGMYLERLGVAAAAVTTATRGALDATGHDETTWRLDRRVDVELAN
jgi:peptidoglycan-associated lipoprotein